MFRAIECSLAEAVQSGEGGKELRRKSAAVVCRLHGFDRRCAGWGGADRDAVTQAERLRFEMDDLKFREAGDGF